MNEDRYGFRVRQALNQGTAGIPTAVARRLEATRHLALARQKQPEPQLATAGHDTPLLRFVTESRHFRQILAAIALLLGMWISFYMDSANYVTELEEVDSALLSDELPPEAFLDNDFFEWLKDDTPED